MKLYYAPGTCSLAVWTSLEWLGLDYEVERVKLGSEEYKKITPLGAVPALDTGDGNIKTQLSAILTYLLETNPDSDLGPDDSAEDRFLFNEIAAFLTGDYHPAFKPMFRSQSYTTSTNEKDVENVKKAAFVQIDRMASHLDDMLDGREHVYKDKKTLLDPYAFILSTWTESTPKSWEEYPNLAKFMRKMQEDEAIKKVLEESSK